MPVYPALSTTTPSTNDREWEQAPEFGPKAPGFGGPRPMPGLRDESRYLCEGLDRQPPTNSWSRSVPSWRRCGSGSQQKVTSWSRSSATTAILAPGWTGQRWTACGTRRGGGRRRTGLVTVTRPAATRLRLPGHPARFAGPGRSPGIFTDRIACRVLHGNGSRGGRHRTRSISRRASMCTPRSAAPDQDRVHPARHTRMNGRPGQILHHCRGAQH